MYLSKTKIILKKTHPRTHLIESYATFIHQLYTHQLLAINTFCNVFDESICCILEAVSKVAYYLHIKVPYELDFKYFAMKFLHCVLMVEIIVDMSPLWSFTYLNWHEIQLKSWKLSKWNIVFHPSGLKSLVASRFK